MQALRVAPDTVVTFAYVLCDDEGTEIDRAHAAEPASYVHGYGEVLPGLEDALDGMAVGERRSVVLPPARAFGEHDEEAVVEVDRAELPLDRPLEIDDEVVLELPGGEELSVQVVEVREDAVLLDMNHPFAGVTVRCDLLVLGLRPASEAEIAAAQARLEERVAALGAAAQGEHACGGGHDHADNGAGAHGALVRLGRARSTEA